MRRLLAFVAVLWVVPASASAQDPPTISSVLAMQQAPGAGTDRIEVEFDREFGTEPVVSSAENKTHYRLVDVGVQPVQELSIDSATVRVAGRRGQKGRSSLVVLRLLGRLEESPEGRYVLVVSGVQFASGTVQGWSGTVPFGSSNAAPDSTVRRVWDGADDRDSSDIYFAGEAGRSAGVDFFGALDLKAQYPIGYTEWGGRIHTFSPSFDLRASSNPDADPDSANISLRWRWNPLTGVGRILALGWTNSAGLESAKDFDTSNFLWSTQALLVSDTWQSSHTIFYVRPFLGFEAGKSLSRPDGAPERGAVARTTVGSVAVLKISVLKGVSLEASYERKQLHKDEPLDGSTLSKGGRSWFEAKLNFAFTKFWGAFIGFEDGRRAPVFNDVKERLRFGFSYRARVMLK